ncbi:MAG: NAD(P)-binding domain-containing protein [Desulfurococcales archaeon]|nr:NAD(P)-binding domain-containing protein [Desulfurococcales archaeon]
MRIVIVGSGYVGKSIGSYMSKLGHEVFYYDSSKKVLDDLKRLGENVIYSPKEFPRNVDVYAISVPTPVRNDGTQDLSAVINALGSIATPLRENSSNKPIIMIKSTILPLTTEKKIIPHLKEITGLNPNKDFGIIYSPEFITEIHHTWTDDPRFAINAEKEMLVIGESNIKVWGDIIVNELYLGRKKAFRTNYRTAEAIKYVLNAALATRISFWNEIFLIMEKLDIDSDVIAKIVGSDPRVGPYGTVHKKAFGGKCLPKDLKTFIKFAEKYHNPVLLKAVQYINEYMASHYGVRE